MTQKLVLVFYTDTNKTYSMTIDSPKLPVDVPTVQTAIDSILNNNVIETKNGFLTKIKEVNVITRTVEPIELV